MKNSKILVEFKTQSTWSEFKCLVFWDLKNKLEKNKWFEGKKIVSKGACKMC